jgi:hypothetical protein
MAQLVWERYPFSSIYTFGYVYLCVQYLWPDEWILHQVTDLYYVVSSAILLSELISQEMNDEKKTPLGVVDFFYFVIYSCDHPTSILLNKKHHQSSSDRYIWEHAMFNHVLLIKHLYGKWEDYCSIWKTNIYTDWYQVKRKKGRLNQLDPNQQSQISSFCMWVNIKSIQLIYQINSICMFAIMFISVFAYLNSQLLKRWFKALSSHTLDVLCQLLVNR